MKKDNHLQSFRVPASMTLETGENSKEIYNLESYLGPFRSIWG